MKLFRHLLAIGFFRFDLAIGLLFIVGIFVYSNIVTALVVSLVALALHYLQVTNKIM